MDNLGRMSIKINTMTENPILWPICRNLHWRSLGWSSFSEVVVPPCRAWFRRPGISNSSSRCVAISLEISRTRARIKRFWDGWRSFFCFFDDASKPSTFHQTKFEWPALNTEVSSVMDVNRDAWRRDASIFATSTGKFVSSISQPGLNQVLNHGLIF